MTESKIINAGLYIRVSTERQVQEGYSVLAQKENLTNFAKQQGWNIFDIYADEGISGKNIRDRPDVKRLINDIKNKKVSVVVLYKFDRLTRDMSDTEEIIKLIQECGIEVYTISGGIVDVKTATGRFMTRVTGAVAQLEREQTIERVKVAFIQKVKQGKSLCSSTASYGYDRPKHQEIQTINKEESIVVKKIFKMYADGKTFTEIADILNAEGIPTKNKGRLVKKRFKEQTYVINSVWQAKTVRLILSNITYIGGVRYGINYKNGFEQLNGLHEPIISKDLWDKVQARIRKIKKAVKTNVPKDDVYYCGSLVCGICGHKLTTQRTIKSKKDGSRSVHYSYRCANREKGLCPALGMSHKKVEEVFLNYIDNIDGLSVIESMTMVKNNDDVISDINNLKKRLAEISSKRKEVMNLFMENQIKHSQMSYMIKELDKKSDLLATEIYRIEKEYYQSLDIDKKMIARTIKEHWQYLSNREKLEFLNQFVDIITIVNCNNSKINGRPQIIDVKFYDD